VRQAGAPLPAERPENASLGGAAIRRAKAGKALTLGPTHDWSPTACSTCHGAKEELDPTIAKTIAAAYPDDKATGYAENDHRGFVWAVVSK
jgi:hypothetical protein